MAKKVKYDKDPDGVKYKYPDRSCVECSRYPCFRNMEVCKCDFAKYGCVSYKQKIKQEWSKI